MVAHFKMQACYTQVKGFQGFNKYPLFKGITLTESDAMGKRNKQETRLDGGQDIILRLSRKTFHGRTDEFAKSLVRQWDTTGKLSDKQWYYAKQMAGKPDSYGNRRR